MRLSIEKIEQSARQKFNEQHGIVSEVAHQGDSVNSIGWSEKEQKYYGWSHRAICGFGIGDMLFEPEFGDDKTPFNKHGSKKIKNKYDARKAAIAFADDVA
jgi:hypothetical protein